MPHRIDGDGHLLKWNGTKVLESGLYRREKSQGGHIHCPNFNINKRTGDSTRTRAMSAANLRAAVDASNINWKEGDSNTSILATVE